MMGFFVERGWVHLEDGMVGSSLGDEDGWLVDVLEMVSLVVWVGKEAIGYVVIPRRLRSSCTMFSVWQDQFAELQAKADIWKEEQLDLSDEMRKAWLDQHSVSRSGRRIYPDTLKKWIPVEFT